MRFNELQRCIGTITYKTLSNTLKEMEAIIMILMKRKTVVAAELSKRSRSHCAPYIGI